MASLMENLIDVLEKESLEYENLLGLSNSKTPVIVEGNFETLAKITDEEQLVVSRINHLDQKREEVMRDIANVINKDVKDLKLPAIITMLEPRKSEQQKVAVVYDKLQTTVHEVAAINERNRVLITEALEMVTFEMNILQATKAAPETANYNRAAFNNGTSIGQNVGGFDAKQ